MTGLKLMPFVVIKLVRIMSREILNVYFMRKVSYAFRAVRALANVVVIIFMFQELSNWKEGGRFWAIVVSIESWNISVFILS